MHNASLGCDAPESARSWRTWQLAVGSREFIGGCTRPCLSGRRIQLLRELTALRGHEFWVDDIALAESEFVDTDRIIGHRQITDAHLVALSLRHRGKLATFDAEIAEVGPAGIDREAQLVILSG